MSEPRNPPKKPSSPGYDRAPPPRPASSGVHDDEEVLDLNFEPDALLDSLLNDPFPADPNPAMARLPRGPKLHEPSERQYSQDEVTVVGHSAEDLVFTNDSIDSTAPPARPTAPAPSPSEKTVVGKSLDELLALSVADSVPPPPPLPRGPELRPAAPPRPAMAPRSAPNAPRPRATPPPFPSPASQPGERRRVTPPPFPSMSGSGSGSSERRLTPPPLPAVNAVSADAQPTAPPLPLPKAPSPETPVVPAKSQAELREHDFPELSDDDEETRVLRMPTELLQSFDPTLRQPATARPIASTARDGMLLEAESFAPPARLFEDSVMPSPRESEAATPMPPRSAPQSSPAPVVPRGPSTLAPFGDEAVTGALPVAPPRPAAAVAPAVPSIAPAGSSVAPAMPSIAPAAPAVAAAAPAVAAAAPAVAAAAPMAVPAAQTESPQKPAKPLDPSAREAWIARAEWLETEAHATSDPQAKARALLVASEHWAIVGDVGRAREVATEASAVARGMTMAGRQLRWLAALEDDHRAVASALELETRSASTPEARVHAGYLSAEVHRLGMDDTAAAKKKYELSLRAHATDARPYLMKLADQLSSSAAPPKLKWPDADELAELARGTEELVHFRSPAQQGDRTPLGAFEDARRALAQGDRTQAANALLALAEVDGLERPARWLAAALFAQDVKTRGRAVEILEALPAGSADASARRARAARGLELADPAVLGRALAGGEQAFSAADRVALATLGNGELASLEAELGNLAGAAGGRALATAAVLTSSEIELEPESGSEASVAAMKLGRRLARAGLLGSADLDALASAIARFGATHPDHPSVRTLGLELAVSRRSPAEIARALGEWTRSAGDPDRDRDRELVVALVQELGGEANEARRSYERALAADPACEPAVRALLEGRDGSEAAELLERLAEAEAAGSQASLHFLEAALRRGSDDAGLLHATLEKAAEADPKLVLPYRLGEQFARRKGDAERLLAWLRARRNLTSDKVELALDLVREALLVAESDLDASAALLREASEARPSDLAIAELYERVAPAGDTLRAELREAAAERVGGAARTRLLIEAALEYERTGDQPAAYRAAQAALAAGDQPLASALLARVAIGTQESTRLAEELLARAKHTDDPLVQRELYEQLSEIEAQRTDGSSSLLWQRAILERSPHYLPALRRLERAYLETDRSDELEPVAAALAETLTGPEAAALARFAARLRLRAGNWAGVRPLAERALEADPKSLWALRALSAQARAVDDPETVLSVERRLHELATRGLDRATAALRAAEAAARLLRWDEAQTFLERALDHVPEHLVALTSLAEVLELANDPAGAASALEAVAEASRVEAHKVNAWYQAGVLWLEKANHADRGRAALEQAVALDLGHDEAVTRLQGIYVARGDRQRLADLLERRLERTNDPEERIAIEVARGRALAEIGEPVAAKAALSAALDANPDHFEALEAFADLCLAQGDWTGAEQAFIRLARHAGDPQRQAQIYRKLGELYDVAIPNPERAELAYQEVLKRMPDDAATVDRLVAVYGRLGATERAVALQTQLLERAESQEARRERTIRLARVLEQIAGDRKRAEATLDRARKEWPHDAAVLRALVELYQKGGEQRAAQVLLDRAAADARRALFTGRFEPALFETLATVADLRGAPDAAAVAHATLAALAGDEMPVRGAGPSAGEARLDELLAPDLLVPALRALLSKLGSVLDAAFPVDVRALRATELPAASAGYLTHVREVARAFALEDVEVLVSPVVGSTCLPAGSSPPTLVFGQALLDSPDEAARYVLLIRALKVVQSNASALARTPPIDLWPMIAGFVGVLAPSFQPQGVDARKLADARNKIQAALPADLDPVLATLALEASAAIGNRASQLSTAAYQLGNRTALLAIGDPLAVLRALAIAGGSSAGPPLAGPERVKWIVRNPEARDLATFSVSEQYAEARRRLGLALG